MPVEQQDKQSAPSKLKAKLLLTLRGYRTLHVLVPGLLLTRGVMAVFSSLVPFVNILFSALILNVLTQGTGLSSVLLLILATVVLNTLVSLGSSGLNRLADYYEEKFWQTENRPLQEKIQEMDYERVEDPETHLLREHIRMRRMTNGLGLSQLIWQYMNLLQNTLTLLFSVSLLSTAFSSFHTRDAGAFSFLFSPWAGLLVVLCMVVSLSLSVLSAKRSTNKIAASFAGFERSNRVGNYYMNHLYNYQAGKDIKLCHLEGPLNGEIQGINIISAKLMSRVQLIMAKYNSLSAAASTLLNGLIYAFVGLKALFGAFGVGSIVQYVGCLSQLGQSLTGIMGSATMLLVNAEALEHFFAFTDLSDPKHLGTLPVEKRMDREYEIEFKNVSFRYPGSESWALRELNLKLNVGRRMAVVGKNGSGKTTMIKLLCRLYDPTEGQITLNGIDIRKYDYREYLSLFSVVFQDFKLFSTSLGQNVAASFSYDEQRAASCLDEAGFSERLSSLKNGLETPLYKDFEEDGVEISGGEAQKIALARALYKNAPFIVLDEPTAALDPLAEYEVYKKFNSIAGDKTAVYISHRLSSCRFCGDIAVFDQGRLVQRGGHEKLLSNPEGLYHSLWNAQAQYYTEEGQPVA